MLKSLFTTLATALTVFVLLASAHAEELDPAWRTLPAPTLVPFTEALAGDVTGDGIADAVLLGNGLPVVLHGAADYVTTGHHALHMYLREQPEDPPETATDVALLPGTGANLADALLVGGDDGLAIWRWDDATGGFTRQALDGPWGPVAHVAAWSPVGAVYYFATAVSADGSQAFPFILHRDSGNIVMHIQTIALAAGPVSDAVFVNTNDDEVPELLVARPGGVTVIDLEGAGETYTLGAYPAGTGGHVAVLPTADRSNERFTWTTGDFFGTSHWLFVVGEVDDGSGPVLDVEGPIDLGPDTVLTTGAGDWNGDQIPDLCVSTTGTDPVLVFFGTGTTPSFLTGLSESVTFPPGGPSVPIGPVETLLFSDLDHDGDDDLLLLDDATAGGVLHRSSWNDSQALRPTTLPQDPYAISDVDDDGDGFIEAWKVNLPHDVTTPDVPGATHVEIQVWIQTEEVELVGGPPGGYAEAELLLGQGESPQPDGTLLPNVTIPSLLAGGPTHDVVLAIRCVRRVEGEPVFGYPPRFVRQTLIWVEPDEPDDPDTNQALGLPGLRGDLEDLDDIPPFGQGSVPLNP